MNTAMPKPECDLTVVLGAILVFSLPVTLLFPGFSVWDVIPKVRVIRFHVVAQQLTWGQLNAALMTLLIIFFCVYLEIRKRKLDEMVENVLTASQATDATMEIERERQSAAMRVCMQSLDASAEHYEHLMLLRDELRCRDKSKKQQPPAIEPSSSVMQQRSS